MRSILFLIVLLFVTTPGSIANKNDNLNLLFIAIDDMNNWVGAWGGMANTPNIDALAQHGMKFTQAFCVVPACNPSRTALLTGQRPETTGQYTNEGNFRNRPGGMERLTLPQFLRNNGYTATAAGKIFHHPRGVKKNPNAMSDDVSWDNQWIGAIGTPGSKLYLDEEGYAAWMEGGYESFLKEGAGNSGMNYMSKAGIWGPIKEAKEETGDWKMADFCAKYLQKKHDEPFFLACGIFRPHSPQLAPAEYFDRYPLDSIVLPEVPSNDMEDIPDIAQENFSTPFVKLVREKKQWKKAIQGYLACMSYADDCVGHVMEALNKSAYKDNTVIVFWTDHGWQLGHKWRWEKFSLWHQATNSPMIIYYPGMKTAGKECKRAVSYLDIYPTVADLLNLPAPRDLEGQSLVPLLENPAQKWDRPAVVTYPGKNYSVNYEHWNFIQYEDGTQELYDHRIDPKEFNNIANLKSSENIIKELLVHIPPE